MRPILFLMFIVLTRLATAQTIVKGHIASRSGEPIYMANVSLEGTYDGASTNEAGKFEFTTDATGLQRLGITFIGYKKKTIEIECKGEAVDVSIVLEEEVSELQAVTISAGSFTASDESRRTIFRAVDIATTAGATADIAGALNTLPGTQKVGESGRLFVRGGEGREARTFIDGMVVLDAYNPAAPNTPSRGRFLPFMFKGTSFSTGGYSAEYGQALSAALVLDSRDETETIRTDIGLMSVGADVAHTHAWDGGSLAGKLQYSNLKPYMNIIDQEIDWSEAPVSLEGVAAFRQRVKEHGILKLYGNFNTSAFSLYRHDIDNYSTAARYELENRYSYINASYRDVLKGSWIYRTGISFTGNENAVSIDGEDYSDDERGVHAKFVAQGDITDRIELSTGVETIHRDFASPGLAANAQETITSAFAESDFYFSNAFVVRAGARAEHNSLNENITIDPRLALSLKTGGTTQVSMAFGTFRQSPANPFLVQRQRLDAEQAAHYILSFQQMREGRTFRIESYYKTYDNLIKREGAEVTNNGDGYARGIELFWRDRETIENLDYWLSYSYLDTERNYLNFPERAVPTYASRHNVSVVGKYFVQALKSQLGATWSFASGRPFHNPNATGFNTGQTPAYQDLSVTWSYLPKPHLIVFFSCTNVLGRDNIFGYEYGNSLNESGQFNRRAIRQPAPRFLFIGIFITLSKDKSVNQLPTL